jgi:uncharacterized membrane protein SpoIIM required for sporulation
MILDLARFIQKQRPSWMALENALDAITARTLDLSDLKESRRVMSLFQRTCSDLARMKQANAGPEACSYLEALVARAYAEIHSSNSRATPFRPLHWLLRMFPSTFRKHSYAFLLSSLLTVLGMMVGSVILVADPRGKEVALAPFSHVANQTPSERVAKEERADAKQLNALEKRKSSFSAQLMANNIGVSIKAMAFGLTWGIGTAILLFYNGVILGAVCLDYLMDGQGLFLMGWLLPHGSFEIPAILIAGQAGLVLAHALIGWGSREGIRSRLRLITSDVATLVGGAAAMLLWAGIVEAFFSQYHAPILPYWIKISFGCVELALLCAFLKLGGRSKPRPKKMR